MCPRNNFPIHLLLDIFMIRWFLWYRTTEVWLYYYYPSRLPRKYMWIDDAQYQNLIWDAYASAGSIVPWSSSSYQRKWSEVYLNVIAHHCHKTSLDSAGCCKQTARRRATRESLCNVAATTLGMMTTWRNGTRDRDDKCLYFIYIFLLFISPQLLPVVTLDGGVFYKVADQ